MALIICITLVLSTGLFMTGLVDLLDWVGQANGWASSFVGFALGLLVISLATPGVSYALIRSGS